MAHLKSTSGEPIHLWLLEEFKKNDETYSKVLNSSPCEMFSQVNIERKIHIEFISFFPYLAL